MALAIAACGGSGSTAATESSNAEEPSSTAAKQGDAPKKEPPGTDAGGPPKVYIPPGPPPKKLVVKDLKLGSGPPVKLDSMLTLNFVGVDYKSRKPFETRWDPYQPFVFEFGPGLQLKGWEEGLPGMRVGGRRKLFVPSELAYGQGDVVYIIDLLAVEDRSNVGG